MSLTLVRFHQNLTKGGAILVLFNINVCEKRLRGYSLEVRNFSFRTCQQCYGTETHKQFDGGGGGVGRNSKSETSIELYSIQPYLKTYTN